MTVCTLDLDRNYKLHRRFDRIGRLVGDEGMRRLFGAHVMVVGVGGVGSFAAEALARSGVGRITLVDFDLICITNANRQIHTLKGMVGLEKSLVMADRVKQINPACTVEPLQTFYNAETAAEILAKEPDFVIDAIDNITAKCHLLAECRRREIPVVCSTGAAARMDPTQIRVTDLAHTTVDPLAKSVRRILREQYDFSRDRHKPFGIPAVYSAESPILPVDLHYDGGKGFRCVCPHGENGQHECEKRNRIDGTTGFVTGAFGLTAASVVVRSLMEGLRPEFSSER